MAAGWDKKSLLELYDLKSQGLSYREIGNLFGKTKGAIAKRWRKTDWPKFLTDPDGYMKLSGEAREWTEEEMWQLYSYVQVQDLPVKFMAEKLNRSPNSIEHKIRRADWSTWREKIDALKKEHTGDDEVIIEKLIKAYLALIRYELNQIDKVSEKEFLSKIDVFDLPVSFSTLQSLACDKLMSMGFNNPETLSLSTGTYIIVGDSHGKHTDPEIVALIKRVSQHLKADHVIHVGHLCDDDGKVNNDLIKLQNLIVLSRVEELEAVQEYKSKNSCFFDIVREMVSLGDLCVLNQDMISDYVRTPIRNLDAEIFDQKVLVNCHRLEFVTRCSGKDISYLASPGCLCDEHVAKSVGQIKIDDNRKVRQEFWGGFNKYRRMSHMKHYWEKGLLVVHVDKSGSITTVPCQIKDTEYGYATSYFDKIITAGKVLNPDKKIFVNADLHCDHHDEIVLDIQEQICGSYKPSVHVNLGDTFNYMSLNHHSMDRGEPILNKKLLDEAAKTHFVLKRMSKWAPESHLIYGNHERFAKDFVAKFPQFGEYLDFKFICGLDGLGYILTDLKDVLKIGSANFLHGEMRMYGQPGTKVEKASRTFGDNTFIGHIHNPSMRFGCCSIGLSGKLDQMYNETKASGWLHGIGLCNQLGNTSWCTTVAIENNKCLIGGKSFEPKNPDNYIFDNYEAKIDYSL